MALNCFRISLNLIQGGTQLKTQTTSARNTTKEIYRVGEAGDKICSQLKTF